MVEVKILKNGGKPIPGNGSIYSWWSYVVTVMDVYNALGDRLKRSKLDALGIFVFAA